MSLPEDFQHEARRCGQDARRRTAAMHDTEADNDVELQRNAARDFRGVEEAAIRAWAIDVKAMNSGLNGWRPRPVGAGNTRARAARRQLRRQHHQAGRPTKWPPTPFGDLVARLPP